MVDHELKGPLFVDLFCGAGGMSVGLKAAGMVPGMGVEFDHWAATTYEKNVGPVLCQDIRRLTWADITGNLERPVSVFVGCPPCQPFSTAGPQNGITDPRNLVPEFLRILRQAVESGLPPKTLIMEEVPAVAHNFKDVLLEPLVAELRRLGYEVSWQVLNCADYGVPQTRRRLFILGGLGLAPTFPEPTHRDPENTTLLNQHLPPWRTLGEAIGGLPTPGNSGIPNHDRWTQRAFTIGGIWGYGLWWDADRPGGTVLANDRNWAPQVRGMERRLTPREVARLQSFPDGHVFHGSERGDTTAAYCQIGNAVPCLMAAHIGRHMLATVDYSGYQYPYGKGHYGMNDKQQAAILPPLPEGWWTIGQAVQELNVKERAASKAIDCGRVAGAEKQKWQGGSYSTWAAPIESWRSWYAIVSTGASRRRSATADRTKPQQLDMDLIRDMLSSGTAVWAARLFQASRATMLHWIKTIGATENKASALTITEEQWRAQWTERQQERPEAFPWPLKEAE